MKKIVFFLILLASFSDSFAFTTQGNWRWRRDDGSQTTATWLAAQNTSFVLTDSFQVVRLRIELYNNPEKPGGFLDGAIIEDSSNIAGAKWTKIKLVPAAGEPFKLAGSSPYVTDLEPTTQQLASPHSTQFQAGQVIVSTEALPPSTVGNNTGTEFEYVLKPTGNLQSNAIYYFRINAAEYISGVATPFLTTGTVLPIQLLNFSAKKDGKKIALNWSTESENNNDRFVVEKATDGRSWRTIATVKGNGTSAQAHKYTSYDEQPAAGINYYRLKQFDKDGRFSVSDVKSLRFDNRRDAIVSVSPNPVKDVVNFKLAGNAIGVMATLSDANGKVVHRQTFMSVQEGTVNQLNLRQKPTAGTYILKLQAEGFSESIKLVVQ